MDSNFVVRNQLGQFWGKKKKWVDGTDPKKIMLCPHEDEGVNLLVELSAKDIDLRGEVVGVELNEKAIPVVEPSEHLIADEPEPELETPVKAQGESETAEADQSAEPVTELDAVSEEEDELAT